jgi:hypothetical protein
MEEVGCVREVLEKNNSITTLYLCKFKLKYIAANGLGDQGAKIIAQALEHNSTLTRLYLGNHIINF